ncbi:hypothetical protein SCHPADRAFT_336399 [Schizopora paradoxa]|uniref:DH domain-containing protein n=1 Tax=Schizopora paradoxa TaxID=27342 RepID=A0A0H2RR26_9AGAM|nr:hypothetical protein SCHPADRAFT_336399 [Schizopora paradoxa]
MCTSRFIKDIIEHEAWYVTKLKSVHESFIKPLEEANPPIFAEGSLPAFFLSTVDGYTEILVTHQSVLCQFFETQSLNPIVQMIRVFEILHGCVRQLHDLYSNYFSSLSDRQRSLKTMQSENTVLLSIVKAMHYPRHMDQIPTEEDDITDLPLHYFEFFTHPLQTLTSSLDTSIPSDYALHRVLIPFMRTVYNVQSKLRRSHENLADISGILEGKRRFLWMNEQIDLDLLNCDRRVLASAYGIMANQSPSGEMDVLLILLDNFLVIVTLPVPNVDEYTLVRLPIACDLISSKGSELGLSLDGPDTFGTGRYQLTILHHTPSTKFNKLTLFLSKLSARLEIVNILENINSEERDQCEGEYLVGEVSHCARCVGLKLIAGLTRPEYVFPRE